jgi:hypothetical protein
LKRKIYSENLPSGGKLGRIAKSIRNETNIKTAEKVMKGFHAFESTNSYPEKAAWVKEMVGRLEANVSPDQYLKIMQDCGRKCFGPTHRKLVRKIWNESKSINGFLNKLNEKGIGGGRLTLGNSNIITGGYDKCYCGLVKKTNKPFPTKTYCHCSSGWYRQLFEAAWEREVQVELLQSIITGAKTCEFIIHI